MNSVNIWKRHWAGTFTEVALFERGLLSTLQCRDNTMKEVITGVLTTLRKVFISHFLGLDADINRSITHKKKYCSGRNFMLTCFLTEGISPTFIISTTTTKLMVCILVCMSSCWRYTGGLDVCRCCCKIQNRCIHWSQEKLTTMVCGLHTNTSRNM